MSALLSRYIDADSLASWGWRIVFLMGIVIAPVGIYIRLRLSETLHQNQWKESNHTLIYTLTSHFKELALGTLLTFGGTSANFMILFALPIIAMKSLGMSQADAVLAGVVTGLTGFAMSPIGGMVSDFLGRKPVILISRMVVIIVVVPLFIWLRTDPTLAGLLIVEGTLSAIAAFGGATGIGSMTELFPRSARATGMAIIYSLA